MEKNNKTVNDLIAEAKAKKEADDAVRLDKKIRAAGSYIIQKHIGALRELGK